MVPELPSFLRRRLRLHEARRALLAGAPEEALERLDDRALLLSEEADRLRERVLDLLCREAFHAATSGDRALSELRFALVDARDPERAARWRRRLEQEAPASGPSSRSGLSRHGESQILTAIEGLLAEMRAERSAAGARASSSAELRAKASPSASGDRRAPSDVHRFRLAVDDAGEYLVVTGEAVVLGHSRAGKADLPFLADLDSRHAELRRGESFHGGPTWTLAPLSGRELCIDGRAVPRAGETLGDGCEVRLAPNLSFRFRAPEPGSGSALLELLHGAECAGALRVLLLAPGASGRMRFGTRARRHVVLRGRECEVTLELRGEELVVASADGLCASGASTASGAEVLLACPPPGRVDFVVGAPTSGHAPFGFSIAPAEDPA